MSIALSIASAVIMIAAIIFSFVKGGEGSTIIGAMGFVSIALAAFGFALGLIGLSQKKVDHKLSFIGTVAAGMIGILMLAIYFVGLK